jgi:hypothetical protein
VTSAWEEYLTGPARPAESGVNWAAYTHDELYQMLWQDADVADVSTVATEWAKHHAALTTHAEVLREQCGALADSWQGPGADEAVRRLETMAARVEKIAELANAGARSAQEAADALATARAMMPAPPGRTPVVGVPAVSTVSVPAAPTSSSVSSLQDYMSSMQDYVSSMQASFAATMPPSNAFTPTAAATPGMGTAFGAVAGGGASFYFGAVTEDQQKAQAVQAMRTYEASLSDSGRMLDDARGAVPRAAPVAAPTTPAGQGSAGVPWHRLVGAAPVGGVAVGDTAGPGVVGSAPLGEGGRVGALPGVSGPGARVVPLAETAAARVTGPGGGMAPVGQRGAGADDKEHENRMPTIDHELFVVDELTVDLTGGHR